MILASSLLLLATLAAPPASPAGAAAPAPLALAPASTYHFPAPRDRFRDWALAAFGPSAIAGDLTSGAWGQWVTGEPEEWTDDGRGFGQRAGVAAATTAITETSFAVLSAAFRQDSRYYRCPRSGLRPRAVHALRMTFVARRTDGSATFSWPKTVSPFIGPLVTRTTLYPDRYTVGDGALSGLFAVAMNAGWNLAYEFVLPSRRW